MKRVIKIFIYTIILLGVLYLLFHFIRLSVIYKNYNQVTENYNSTYYQNLIYNILQDTVSLNDIITTKKNDTIISFETPEQSGALWILNNLSTNEVININKVGKIEKRQDGTYMDFPLIINPEILLSYHISGRRFETKQLRIISTNLDFIHDKKISNADYNHIEFLFKGAVEIQNQNSELLLRIESKRNTHLIMHFTETGLNIFLLQKISSSYSRFKVEKDDLAYFFP